jgi:type IX secretion system PorP/SprF family membrane protein
MRTQLKVTLSMLAVISISVSFAQQTRQSNHYNYNKFGFNTAYAGYSGCTEINFSHMNQWIKVDGAPTTNYLSANTRLGKNFGIGGNVMVDHSGMMRQFTSSIGASYGMTFANAHHVRLGVSGGYFQVQVDPTDAIAFDVGDEIVESGIQSSNALNTQLGAMYAFKGLELSFSSKQLIETRANATYPNLDGYGLRRHLLGYVSYDILLNKRLVLKPNLFYKGSAGVNQFDINADINYDDFIYGGLGYRTEVGIVGRLGVNIRKLFFIAYSYEIPMQNIASYGSGSHEIALGLKFCKKSKDEEIIEDIVEVEPVIDTITIVERVVDTVVIEKVDTVYLDPEIVSDAEVKKAMFKASESLAFEFDKSIIRKESFADLEAFANILLIRDELKISLEGHTDNKGTEEYNMRLSKNRVEAVKKFLVANGIDAKRIKTYHFGESKPIADNSTEEGREANRRVEMRVIEE